MVGLSGGRWYLGGIPPNPRVDVEDPEEDPDDIVRYGAGLSKIVKVYQSLE